MTSDPALNAFLARARRTATLKAVGLRDVDEALPGELPTGELRRRRLRPSTEDAVGYLSLLRGDDGVLWWQTDEGPAPRPSGRRAARRGIAGIELVDQYKFERLHGSQVAAFLDRLDASFNAHRGLRRVTDKGLDGAEDAPAGEGRILLFVHGTFSKGQAMLDGLRSTAEGRVLLQSALRHYDQVLAFEHPTLAVSPIINAVLLSRLFAKSKAAVDVVCHSRGGLVTRWWLESLNTNPRLKPRAIFVASPLQGTSLATPLRLRAALNLLTNVIVVLERTAALGALALPLFGMVAGLMKLVGSVGGALGRTPMVDAAVAMIPGLAAQSRRGLIGEQPLLGNFELDTLSAGVTAEPPEYFVVKGSFEPDDSGWAFWKYFMRPGQRLADAAADVVFPAENDLVVDTASMDALSDAIRVATPSRVLDFGVTADVHHLNYFAQPMTAAFIRDAFTIPKAPASRAR
ncbi:MAG TPA: hypothetical protein VIL35_09900 [Vicinamibacterales bacterium]